MNIKFLESNVLVIGAGGAGLRAAIEAAKYGLRVVILDKSKVGRGGATRSSGGEFAAPFDRQDNFSQFLTDVINGGEHLSEQNLVKLLVTESADRAMDLEKLGLIWLKRSSENYELRKLAGHTHPRTLVSSSGGVPLTRVLVREAKHRKVAFIEEVMATRLIKSENSVVGATALDIQNGDFYAIEAASTILATGGLGQVYEWTSNPRGSTGDGYALAFQSGAELIDMEMVQFNPQGLVWPFSVAGLLQSEETRMHGARYYNASGERFLNRYDPTRMEHTTRDKLSQYIAREVKDGKGTKRGGVILDPSAIPEEQIPSLQKTAGLGGRLQRFYDFGIDPFRDIQEIYPSCHYMMGGIRINERAESSVQGLYACGEVSAGVHGANRLGSDSLTDTQVFGKIAGQYAALHAQREGIPTVNIRFVQKECKRINALLNRETECGISPINIKTKIKQLMSKYVGVIRNSEGLRKSLAKLDRISRQDLPNAYISYKTKCFNTEWTELIETYNAVLVSKIIAQSALMRNETRGAHYREDFPNRDDDKWLCHILAKQQNGKIRLSKLPITKLNH